MKTRSVIPKEFSWKMWLDDINSNIIDNSCTIYKTIYSFFLILLSPNVY